MNKAGLNSKFKCRIKQTLKKIVPTIRAKKEKGGVSMAQGGWPKNFFLPCNRLELNRRIILLTTYIFSKPTKIKLGDPAKKFLSSKSLVNK